MIARNALVRKAIDSLRFELSQSPDVGGSDDTTVAWRLAVAWKNAISFESTYVRASWKALALALDAGDESRAIDAAEWLAEPGKAMARAMDRVARGEGAAA